jgi:opacity protein-like surface antigen
MAFGAGAIASRLLLDFSNFAGGFAQVRSLVGSFPSLISSFMANPLLGLAHVATEAMESVKGAVESVVASVHQVTVEANKAGVSSGFLKQLGAAGKTVDADLGSIAHGVAFLARNAAEAADGLDKAREKYNDTLKKHGKAAADAEFELQGPAKAFADLGIAVTDAAGKIKPTEQLFFEVADAIKALPDAGAADARRRWTCSAAAGSRWCRS